MLTLLIMAAFAADRAEAGPCVATRREVVAGTHLTAGDLETVACRSGLPAAEVVYSAETRSTVAQQMLPTGTYLGRLYADSAIILPKGSRVVLRAVAGPAVIEREVVTLQPARSGQRVFVRDGDGRVFAVPLIVAEEPE
jgi:flagella basal body P-ring formation protein FlgA